MIKKLRRKFVFINMLLVSAILITLFSSVLYMTHQGLVRDSETALYRVMNSMATTDSANDHYRPNLSENNVQVPYFTLLVDRSGRAIVANSQYFVIDSDVVKLLMMQTLASPENKGVIEEYSLRFLKSETVSGWKIVFVTTALERNTMRNMFFSSALIGSVCFVLFLFISILLARWAVKPVQRSWDQQQQFVADASHELKTPLTIIMSNTDMLLSGDDADTIHTARRLDNIKVASERMKKLVEDMLCLAQNENLTAAPIYAPVDFSDAATESILLSEPTIFENKRILVDDIEENIFVLGDSDKLKQVVTILLDNACKYSPVGETITIALRSDGKKKAVLSVNNKGEAMTQEQQAHIFERFYRTDTARKDNGSYGLGLAIAKSIVTAHKGKIRVESNDASGTTFFAQFDRIEGGKALPE